MLPCQSGPGSNGNKSILHIPPKLQHYRILNIRLFSLISSTLVSVAYWPPTWPSCQKKKCTCVNNRWIQSEISGDQGWPWPSRGWIDCEIVTLAGSRWTLNYYITPATGSSDQLERRCWNENHVPAEDGPPGPRLSIIGERERNTVIARRVGVNMLQYLFGLQLTSHTQPFRIKWEVYFLKNCVRSSLLRLHASAYEYATLGVCVWKVLPFCRDAVNVFYSLSWLSY